VFIPYLRPGLGGNGIVFVLVKNMELQASLTFTNENVFGLGTRSFAIIADFFLRWIACLHTTPFEFP